MIIKMTVIMAIIIIIMNIYHLILNTKYLFHIMHIEITQNIIMIEIDEIEKIIKIIITQ